MIRTILFAALAITAVLAAPKLIEDRSLEKDAVCTSPLQCKQPFYCLPGNGTTHKCAFKPCRAEGECIIGQFCGKNNLCDVKKCAEDTDCPGQTVCKSNAKCGTKGSTGQECSRDGQCWSDKCSDSKCADAGNIVTDNVATGGLKKLGGGGIAGIVIGALLLLALLALCCCCLPAVKAKLFKKKDEAEVAN